MCGMWLLAPAETTAFGIYAYGGLLSAPTADGLRPFLLEYLSCGYKYVYGYYGRTYYGATLPIWISS